MAEQHSGYADTLHGCSGAFGSFGVDIDPPTEGERRDTIVLWSIGMATMNPHEFHPASLAHLGGLGSDEYDAHANRCMERGLLVGAFRGGSFEPRLTERGHERFRQVVGRHPFTAGRIAGAVIESSLRENRLADTRGRVEA